MGWDLGELTLQGKDDEVGRLWGLGHFWGLGPAAQLLMVPAIQAASRDCCLGNEAAEQRGRAGGI